MPKTISTFFFIFATKQVHSHVKQQQWVQPYPAGWRHVTLAENNVRRGIESTNPSLLTQLLTIISGTTASIQQGQRPENRLLILAKLHFLV